MTRAAVGVLSKFFRAPRRSHRIASGRVGKPDLTRRVSHSTPPRPTGHPNEMKYVRHSNDTRQLLFSEPFHNRSPVFFLFFWANVPPIPCKAVCSQNETAVGPFLSKDFLPNFQTVSAHFFCISIFSYFLVLFPNIRVPSLPKYFALLNFRTLEIFFLPFSLFFLKRIR